MASAGGAHGVRGVGLTERWAILRTCPSTTACVRVTIDGVLIVFLARRPKMHPYVLALLRNRFTDSFHPVLFAPAPLPSIAGSGATVSRYRVKGYCTEGFKAREDAVEFAKSRWLPSLSDVEFAFGSDLDWGGRDAPTFTCLYSSIRQSLVAFE
jgi:hypothetical protein